MPRSTSSTTRASVFPGEIYQAPYFTTKLDPRGTGLGLMMVRDFARRAGGSAEIQSQLGAATSVILRLPVFRMGLQRSAALAVVEA